ncbi:MAG: energy transducer TonB [Verrucomicrobia bacterium]|nr:energy transducer TonB [Cytophagales bacterium]
MKNLFYLCLLFTFAKVSAQNFQASCRKAINENGSMVSVEVAASFPGGYAAMFDYLKSNLQYPAEASEKRASGTVFVALLITETGKLDKISIRQSVGFGCDEEAIRLIQAMPNWIPAQQNGKALRTKLMIPIPFENPMEQTLALNKR